MNRFLAALALFAVGAAPDLRPDQIAFRELFRELVETDTSVATGSCTAAAAKLAARLRSAGYTDRELTPFAVPEFPLDGGLVAVLPGRDGRAKPILLLGHLDVVNARREDWQRDPFRFIEENGSYYGRGTADMKAMVATWVDTLARLRTSGYRPHRTIKLALTCGEESGARFNGAEWLAKNRPALIAAEFALNEGGGGEADRQGHVVVETMQVGEKANRSFDIEATNPGGHSSIPVPDNAIYDLSRALLKVADHRFPLRFNDTTRTFFAASGPRRGDAIGAAMVRLAGDPTDSAAEAIVSADRTYNSMLRTTCVATMLDGGHAANALPQRARSTVNCRIVPGEDADTTRAALIRAIGNPAIKVTLVGRIRPVAVVPPLSPRVMAPAQALVARYFPGVPLIPAMSTGATDATYLSLAGIPTYGVPGGWGPPDGSGAHGLNEHMPVRSVMVGRDSSTIWSRRTRSSRERAVEERHALRQHRRLAAERHRQRHDHILVTQPRIIDVRHRRTERLQPRGQVHRIVRAHLHVLARRQQQQRRRVCPCEVDRLRHLRIAHALHGIARTLLVERVEVVRPAHADARADDLRIDALRAQPAWIERQHRHRIAARRMPRDRHPSRIAAEFAHMVARPADRLRGVLHEGGEADVRHLAIVWHHDDEAGARERPRGEVVRPPVAMHPAAAIEPHQHRPWRARLARGRPDIQRLARRPERHVIGDQRRPATPAEQPVAPAQQPRRLRVPDGDAKPDDHRQRDQQKPAHQASYAAVVFAATSSALTPSASSTSRNGDA